MEADPQLVDPLAEQVDVAEAGELECELERLGSSRMGRSLWLARVGHPAPASREQKTVEKPKADEEVPAVKSPRVKSYFCEEPCVVLV